MAFGNSDKITWNKTSDTECQTKGPRRGYTGTITLDVKPNPYKLEITPGPVNSEHATFKAAKNAFRKFLLDKPVS